MCNVYGLYKISKTHGNLGLRPTAYLQRQTSVWVCFSASGVLPSPLGSPAVFEPNALESFVVFFFHKSCGCLRYANDNHNPEPMAVRRKTGRPLQKPRPGPCQKRHYDLYCLLTVVSPPTSEAKPRSIRR